MADSNRPMRSQRVDPWMILWPMIALALGGAGYFLSTIVVAIVLPTYLEASSDFIDQMVLAGLGPTYSRFVTVAVAVVGVVAGYVLYKKLTRGTYSSERKVRTIGGALAWVSILWLVVSYVAYYMLGYPFAFAGPFSRVVADATIALCGSMAMIVGVGHVLDYHDFAAAARQTGASVGVFVVRESQSPSLVEKATSPMGGSFFMLLDPQVKRIELHTVPMILDNKAEKPASVDEVRREQRLI